MTAADFYLERRITQRFGSNHAGLDYAWGEGTDIPSFAVGVVAAEGYDPGYGYWVAIDTGNGEYIGWAHMLERSPLNAGDPVFINTTVGQVGRSGSFPTGYHVHVYRGASPRPDSRPKLNPLGLVTAGINITPIAAEELDVTEIRYYTRRNPQTKRDEWMLTHPLIFTDGVFITGDLTLANGFGPYTGTSALLPDDRWAGVIRTAKLVYDASWAAEARKAAMQASPTIADVKLAVGEATAIARAVVHEQKLPGN